MAALNATALNATALNPTHDASVRSWVDSANADDTDFPIQNLPYGILERDGRRGGAVAIGDQVLDIGAALDAGWFEGAARRAAEAASAPTLNALMALPPADTHALRAALFDMLRADGTHAGKARADAGKVLVPAAGATLHLPCRIEGYTDFLTSIHHTERHGKLKGLKDPLPPAFKYLPVAYHGRTSSIRVSGPDVVRPHGQWKAADGSVQFGSIEAMDFELELGLFVGQGNAQASPIPIDQVADYLFGFCLLNDWSAKSIQWWEQVLGPFLGKNFHTTVSPWVVTAEALAPFRTAACARPDGDPAPLPHLASDADQRQGAFDIQLEAWLSSDTMRSTGDGPARISQTNAKTLYWTFGQMVAHHTSNGCNLLPGDLIGSGTVSGEARSSMACMTEMTSAGAEAITLPNGETRKWLKDGDEIVLRGKAEKAGFRTIGFGECRGRIAPSR